MTAFIKYVTFDCADTRGLSTSWSAVTGCESVSVPNCRGVLFSG
jgi:hypothetical protein